MYILADYISINGRGHIHCTLRTMWRIAWALALILSASASSKPKRLSPFQSGITTIPLQKGNRVDLNCSDWPNVALYTYDESSLRPLQWLSNGSTYSVLFNPLANCGSYDTVCNLCTNRQYECSKASSAYACVDSSTHRIWRTYFLVLMCPPHLYSQTATRMPRNCSRPIEGYKYQLHCLETDFYCPGVPVQSHIWRFNNESVDNFSSDFRVSGSVLFIKHLVVGSGNYSCELKNSLGSATVTYNIVPRTGQSECELPCSQVPDVEWPPPDEIFSASEYGDVTFNASIALDPANTIIGIWKGKSTLVQCYIPMQFLFYLPPNSTYSNCINVDVTGCNFTQQIVIRNANNINKERYTIQLLVSNTGIVQDFFVIKPQSSSSSSSNKIIIIGASSGGGAVLVVVVVVVFVSFFYHRKRSFKMSSRSLLRTKYDYDFFVAHSERDSKWLNKYVVDFIRGNDAYAGVTLLLHNEDFVLGKRVRDNIKDLIKRCWKIIAVVSHNSVESHWCRFEWSQAAGFDESFVIPLIIDDVDETAHRLLRSTERSVKLFGRSEDDVKRTIGALLDEKWLKSKETVDIFFAFDSVDDTKRVTKDIKEFLRSNSLTFMSVPKGCVERNLDSFLTRSLLLSKKAICFVSSRCAVKMWPRLREVAVKQARQYKFLLIVEPGVDDVNVDSLDCKIIQCNCEQWKKELANFLT